MVTCAMTTYTPVEKQPQSSVLSTFFSGDELDAVKGSDLEEVNDRDSDRNAMECEESFLCCIPIMDR